MTFMDLTDDKKPSKSNRKGKSKAVLDLQSSGAVTVKRLLDASALAGFDDRAAKVKGKEKSGFFRTPTYQRIRKTLAAYTSKQEGKSAKWRTTTVATLDKLIDDFTSKRKNIADRSSKDGQARWNAVWFLRPTVKAELRALLRGDADVAPDTEEQAAGDMDADEASSKVEDVADDDSAEGADLVGEDDAKEVADDVGEEAESEAAEEEIVDQVFDETGWAKSFGPLTETGTMFAVPETDKQQWDADRDREEGRVPRREYANSKDRPEYGAPFWEDEDWSFADQTMESDSKNQQSANASEKDAKASSLESSSSFDDNSLTSATRAHLDRRKLRSSQHETKPARDEMRTRRAVFLKLRAADAFSSQVSDNSSARREARERRTRVYKELGAATTQARAAKHAGATKDAARERFGALESWASLGSAERQKRQLLWDIGHDDTVVPEEFKWKASAHRGSKYEWEFTKGSGQLEEFYSPIARAAKLYQPDGTVKWTTIDTPGAIPLQTHEERAEAAKRSGANWTVPFLAKYWDKLTNLAKKDAWPQAPHASDSTNTDSVDSDDGAASDERVGVEKVTKEERESYRVAFSGSSMKLGPKKETLDTRDMATNFSGQGFGIFVMSRQGQIYIGRHQAGLFHHSSFLAGANVSGAGEMSVQGGKLAVLTNKSGHYKPQTQEMLQVILELREHGVKPSSYEIKFNNLKDAGEVSNVTAADFLHRFQNKLPKGNRYRAQATT